jgi:hypothetical protein
MPNAERLTPKDLVVGERYLHVNRLFIRQIEAIEGDTVSYHDQYGQGSCSTRAFLKACPTIVSSEESAKAEKELAHTTRMTEGEFSLRMKLMR